MADYSDSLIKILISKIKNYPKFSENEVEKFCWMAAHEHKHGILPSEYDIREIDESLYLILLKQFKTEWFNKLIVLDKTIIKNIFNLKNFSMQ